MCTILVLVTLSSLLAHRMRTILDCNTHIYEISLTMRINICYSSVYRQFDSIRWNNLIWYTDIDSLHANTLVDHWHVKAASSWIMCVWFFQSIERHQSRTFAILIILLLLYKIDLVVCEIETVMIDPQYATPLFSLKFDIHNENERFSVSHSHQMYFAFSYRINWKMNLSY